MGDKVPDEENDGKDQEPYVHSVGQNSEEFIEDDTVPSLFLEDVEGDKEVWLLECPLTIEPTKLLGKQLHFGRDTSFTTDDVGNERIIVHPIREEGVACCLMSSCYGESINAVGLQYAGKLKINLRCDVPCSELMIPDDGTVQLPEDLKLRHPFLGPRYQTIVEGMRSSEKYVNKIKKENIEQNIPKKKKRKNTSIGANYEDNIGSEEIEAADEPVVEFVSMKKKKKHKQRELPEEVPSTYEHIKMKKEKIPASPKKSHDLNQYSDTWTDVSAHVSETIKKEKTFMVPDGSEDMLGFQNEFPQPKEKKKKHHRKRDTDDDIEVQIYEDGGHTSKKAKKRKSELPVMLEEPLIETQEITNEDTNKVKKKKRHKMDNADLQYDYSVSDGHTNHFGEESNGYQTIVEGMRSSEKYVNKIKKENIEQNIPKKKKRKNTSIGANYEDNIGSEEIEAADEPVVEFVSMKKKKKHKQRELPEEVPSTYEHIKMKKEKIPASPKKSHDLNQYSDTWTDVSAHVSETIKKEKTFMVPDGSEDMLGFQNEFPQPKEKKKKHHRKRDTDDDIEVQIYEDGGHTSKKAKKRKSELPVMLEEPLIETQEITNEDTNKVKKKKRHKMDNADLQYDYSVSDGHTNHFGEESNGYQTIVEGMRSSEKYVNKIKKENIEQNIPKKKKRKNTSIGANYEDNIGSEEIEAADEPVVEFVSMKKKKKHKQRELPEEVPSTYEHIKMKKEKIPASPKKSHDLNQYSDTWTDVSAHVSETIKKEKTFMVPDGSEDMLGFQNEFPQPKEKKKKHHRKRDTDDDIEVQIYEDGGHTSKKAKKRKSELPVMLEEPLIETQEITNEDTNKVKKKKRHKMDNADLQYDYSVSDGHTNHFGEESNGYQTIVEGMRSSEKYVNKIKKENIEQNIPKKKKRKNTSIGANYEDNIGSEEIEAADEPVVEFVSMKKKKKHKQRELPEEVPSTYEHIKMKKEKIPASPKKSHDLNQYSDTWTDVSAHVSETIKKEKTFMVPDGSEDM